MIKKTILLPIDDPHSLERTVKIIQDGGVIAFPTDTVYGIGASAFNEAAIEKLYQVKGRTHQKAIPILIDSANRLKQVIYSETEISDKLVDRYWPGPLTLIFPINPDLPHNLSSGNTIGVRVPDHDLIRDLLKMTGPLAATSANFSGKPSGLTAGEVQEQLGDEIDLILDGGRVPGGMASTVLDCSGSQIKILRAGPISMVDITKVLNE